MDRRRRVLSPPAREEAHQCMFELAVVHDLRPLPRPQSHTVTCDPPEIADAYPRVNKSCAQYGATSISLNTSRRVVTRALTSVSTHDHHHVLQGRRRVGPQSTHETL